MKRTFAITLMTAALLFCGALSPAWGGCPVKAEEDAKAALAQEKKLNSLLAAAIGDQGQNEVVLTEPGTVTTTQAGRGLETPRPWTPAEKQRLDSAKVNPSLPAPAGVWK